MITEKTLSATIQKSYYGKAKIIDHGNGNIALKSYDKIVCGICDGKFIRYWGGYSRTTLNHVNDFRLQYNLPKICKKEWEEIPVFSDTGARYRVILYSVLGFKERKVGPIFDNWDDAYDYSEKIVTSQFWFTEIVEV